MDILEFATFLINESSDPALQSWGRKVIDEIAEQTIYLATRLDRQTDLPPEATEKYANLLRHVMPSFPPYARMQVLPETLAALRRFAPEENQQRIAEILQVLPNGKKDD
jgi:hypothetical protein